MSDLLSFDLELDLADFRLRMAAEVPLHGITAISGPSGSGKTTLLRLLAGLEARGRGHVRLGVRDLQNGALRVSPHRRGIGYVFQEPRLFPHLGVLGNLQFGAKRRKVPRGRIDDIVDLLDLAPLLERDTRGLSGGEARRVALGRVLASGPEILFLDEPLTGLDAVRKAEILPHVARAALGLGLPALFVSHVRDEVLSLADRMLMLAGGQVTGWAPPPVRLRATVAGVGADGAVFDLGGNRFTLPLAARPGEIWSLALSETGTLLSRDAPGANTALFQLPVSVEPGVGGDLTLVAAGQSLSWRGLPVPRDVTRGGLLWLSVLAVHPRPEPRRQDGAAPRQG